MDDDDAFHALTRAAIAYRQLRCEHGELMAEVERLRAENERFREIYDAHVSDDYEICQALGAALGYPWFKDDQKYFPGATESNGVCTGEHVAVSIAAKAAAELTSLRAAVRHALVELPMLADAASGLVAALGEGGGA